MRLRRRILSKQRRYESIATEMKIFLVFIVAFPLCTFSQTSTPDVSMNATSSIQPSSSTENALANDTASQTVEAESFHVNSSTVMVTGNVSTDVSAAPTVLDNQSSTSLSMTPSPSSLPNSTVATSVDDVSPTLNSSSMELPMTISVNSSTDVATSSVVTEVSSTSLGMESSSRVEVEPSTTPTAAQPSGLSQGAIIGIAVGAAIAVIIVIVLFLICLICCCCCRSESKERYQAYSITTRYWDNTTGAQAHYQAGGSLRSITRNASLRSSLGLRPKVGGQNGDYIANPAADLTILSTPL